MATILDWANYLSCIFTKFNVRTKPLDVPVVIGIPMPDFISLPTLPPLPDWWNMLPPPPLTMDLGGIPTDIEIPFPINFTLDFKILWPGLPDLPTLAFACPWELTGPTNSLALPGGVRAEIPKALSFAVKAALAGDPSGFATVDYPPEPESTPPVEPPPPPVPPGQTDESGAPSGDPNAGSFAGGLTADPDDNPVDPLTQSLPSGTTTTPRPSTADAASTTDGTLAAHYPSGSGPAGGAGGYHPSGRRCVIPIRTDPPTSGPESDHGLIDPLAEELT